MGWGEYGRSIMPLKLVFILMAAVAVNLMLIESFKVLLLFDHADNLEAVNLAAIDSRYANCTVIDTYTDKDENTPFWENHFTFHLLENAHGERLLAVVENHFLFPRARYWENLSAEVPSFASNEAPVFGGNSGSMGYTCTLAPDRTIQQAHAHGQSGLSSPLLLTVMLIVEYISFIFLFRREEIQ
jgi:hypothetical protein